MTTAKASELIIRRGDGKKRTINEGYYECVWCHTVIELTHIDHLEEFGAVRGDDNNSVRARCPHCYEKWNRYEETHEVSQHFRRLGWWDSALIRLRLGKGSK